LEVTLRQIVEAFTETTYNKIGQVTAVLDARGFVTTYEYDALNRVVKVSLPHDPEAESFGYAVQRSMMMPAGLRARPMP
jgi:YD repeat-containing protein